MYNNTNPAELFAGTTWELVATDKYIKTGNTPLQQGGSNSVSIVKANLPNVKLKIDSFSLTTQPHFHYEFANIKSGNNSVTGEQFPNVGDNQNIGKYYMYIISGSSTTPTVGKSSTNGGQNTGTASPSTEALGSGTALNIQPAYITLKFWKRLS